MVDSRYTGLRVKSRFYIYDSKLMQDRFQDIRGFWEFLYPILVIYSLKWNY